MKWTILFLTVLCTHVSARGWSQTITFSGKDVPLQIIIGEIEKQSGYAVFCNANLLTEAQPVTISATNEALNDFLGHVLRPLRLDYLILKTTIVISKSKLPPGLDIASPAVVPPPPVVTGTVLDAGGKPLPDASVKVRRTGEGTTTDSKGDFSVEAVKGDVLDISYTGYLAKEVKIGKDDHIKVTMSLADTKLDEIQIVAYGQNTKRFNVGNVTTIKAEDIAKSPVPNVLQALSGRVPGVMISPTSGWAGTSITVAIQGQNSISNGNLPFYVIDGVPFMSELPKSLGNVGSSQTGAASNPLSYINPADIESVTILKDADATAIYGSRAANGAILVTTKRGKAGVARVDINLRNGRSTPGRRIKLMSKEQYLAMRHEALRNDGAAISDGDYDLNGTWDTTRAVDWQRAVMGNHADYTEVNVGVSGGSPTSIYTVGLMFGNQGSLVPLDNLRDRKGSVHFAQNIANASQRFKMNMSVSYMYDDNQLPRDDVAGMTAYFSPVGPDLYNPDGSLNWGQNRNGSSTWYNPFARYLNTQRMTSRSLNSTVNISYELVKGLVISSRLGYQDFLMRELVLYHLEANRPEDLPYISRSSTFSTSTSSSFNIEPQLSFNRAIGAGRLSLTGGFTINQQRQGNNNITGIGYATDEAMKDITLATQSYQGSSYFSQYKVNSGFGRLEYIHARKYILNFTGRRDGTSRFGTENPFHNFGSVGAGWIMSEEPFFSRLLKTVSFAKVNASYGTLGNDQIGNYQYMNLYVPQSMPINYQGGLSMQPLQLANPQLQWEQTKKFNGGISLGFLKQRVTVDLDYYRNESSNQLVGYGLPAITGFGSIARNRPATVRNWGYDVIVCATAIQTKDITWTARLNVSFARNLLAKYPGFDQSTDYVSAIVGKPLAYIELYRYAGVDPQTGLYSFIGRDGKRTNNPNFDTDRISGVDMTPFCYGGLDNTISYKGLSLSLFFYFTKQKLGGAGSYVAVPGSMFNQPLLALDRWQKPGDQAKYQRFSASNPDVYTAFDRYHYSDANYQDGSYIKLKNITLSWAMPSSLCSRLHLKDLQIFGNTQNVFTITSFQTGDPEGANVSLVPQPRTIAVGIKAGL